MKSGSDQLYGVDMKVGHAFSGSPRVLNDEAFRRFAELTGDSHPIHYDPDYARQTRFGRQVAHGLLLTSMTALGATEFSSQIEDSMIAFVEQQFKFIKAGLLDDVVTSHFEIVEIEQKPERNIAIVTFAVELTNQQSERLMQGIHRYMFKLDRTIHG